MSRPDQSNPLALSGAQRRALRALGHHLRAVVQIGHGGITEGLVAATSIALEDHELIKVSIGRECPLDRKVAPEALADATGAHVAQVIGRTALLFRRRLDDPEIALPGTFEDAPRPTAEDPPR